jgi:hypothetical protein
VNLHSPKPILLFGLDALNCRRGRVAFPVPAADSICNDANGEVAGPAG